MAIDSLIEFSLICRYILLLFIPLSMAQDPRLSHTIIGIPPPPNPLSVSNISSKHQVYQDRADPHTFFVDDYSHKLKFTHHGSQQTVPVYYPSQTVQGSSYQHQVETVQKQSKFTPNPFASKHSRVNSSVLPPIREQRVTSVIIPQVQSKVAAPLPTVTTHISSVNTTQVPNNSATVGAGQAVEQRYKDEGQFLCGKRGWILLALLILAVLTLALLYSLGILGGTPSKRVSSSGGAPVSPFPNNNGAGSSSTTNHPSGQNGKINGQTKPTPLPINNQTGKPSSGVNINKLVDQAQEEYPGVIKPQEPNMPSIKNPKDNSIIPPNSILPSPVDGQTPNPNTNTKPLPRPPSIQIPALPPAPSYIGVPKFDFVPNFIPATPVQH